MTVPTPSELRIDFPPSVHGTLNPEAETEIRRALVAWHASRVAANAVPDPLHVLVTPLTAPEVWVDPAHGIGAWFQAGNVVDVFVDTRAPLGPGAAARTHLAAHLDAASARLPAEAPEAPGTRDAPAVVPPTVATMNDGNLRLVFCERPGAMLTNAETDTLVEIARQAHRRARNALTSLDHPITIAVTPTPVRQSNQSETSGLGAYTPSGSHLHLFLNRGMTDGLDSSLHAHLDAMLAHELHHCARFAAIGIRPDRLEQFVFEGLATAHERDVSGVMPPHGDYSTIPAEAWLAEALSDTELGTQE